MGGESVFGAVLALYLFIATACGDEVTLVSTLFVDEIHEKFQRGPLREIGSGGNVEPAVSTSEQKVPEDQFDNSWSLVNTMSIEFTADCHRIGGEDLGIVTVLPQDAYVFRFVTGENDQTWWCDFEMRPPNTHRYQQLNIWEHSKLNSPQMQTCFNCLWQIGSDGFYILDNQSEEMTFMADWGFAEFPPGPPSRKVTQ